ncbi:5-formyltetrahydrofolate cyclo-ligase [Metschnikowia bicuspidata var. bicuspidata NRRL YB-4993]|uniref:5-formyltetrahydrofolate cyclo-ligase n=1 Tax=Metschnikowia bicuspidata var. bicuspidata NRRL YB-4993 TaxID=869754 RepID=A0A1A0H6N1_9ASCO|nr:5-formyltetrahydrofolate cyclo-ligase [Metschnikowia bicuspidata var. bicuspidata NRRL YB-4993]OBA19567.1 5-formyltetrahydrofolate cyclo-ligase [Metschnikowia bicuspidata var. bicuspidata NRRL YB-4993]
MSRLAKNDLRKAIKTKLSHLSEARLAEQSQSVFDALIKHQEFRNAKSVALFMSMPRVETSTGPILRYCFDHEKTVFLPKCLPPSSLGNSMTFLNVKTLDEVNALQPAGKYKLREPAQGEDAMETGNLDLIIVPGVAFTLLGNRLGHGAGYYDKFLHDFQAKFDRVPYLMGVCLAEQLAENVPIEPHDWTMNHVIVGRGMQE